MIRTEKQKGFSSCNCCGGYTTQPDTNSGIKFLECGDVYSYFFGINSFIEIRLCSKCAYELKELLEKQLGENK